MGDYRLKSQTTKGNPQLSVKKELLMFLKNHFYIIYKLLLLEVYFIGPPHCVCMTVHDRVK